MPTAVVPSIDNQPFTYAKLDPTGTKYLIGARRMYYDVTTSAAVSDTLMTGQSVLHAVWSPATSDDGVVISIAAGHPSALTLTPRGAAARTGVLCCWLKSGKRPNENNNDTDNVSTFTYVKTQEKFRPRRNYKQRQFYFGDQLTGDTSYTWTPGIYGIKHVYWSGDSAGDDIAPTVNVTTGAITMTAPNTNPYTGTLLIESLG